MASKRVSIPEEGAAVARPLIEYFLRRTREELEEETWWKTCPQEERSRIEIKLVGIEERPVRAMIGGTSMAPSLVATASAEIDGTE